MATTDTTVVISGGGPAGMMLGLLLGRAGIDVTVLEKHGDFLRDFRGDTVHASTIRLLDELGLGEKFRELPQSRMGNLEMPDRTGTMVTLGDFGSLPKPYDYVAMMPQWDLLTFLAEAAAEEPSFTLRMNTETTGLLKEGKKAVGVRYRTAQGVEGHIRADLTISCEGRQSTLRRVSGLTLREFPVPYDTWWFRLPRHAYEQGEVARLLPKIQGDEILMTLFRADYYQLAYLTHKGYDARLRTEGVERFRARIGRLRPEFADRLNAIASMDEVHLLDVKMNRLRHWFTDGLLCIGDAAHAMTPVGGVGINLAIQDAVATARLLADPLRRANVTTADLARVQARRERPARIVQAAQRAMQRVMFVPAFEGRRSGPPGAFLFLGRHVPALRRMPARFIAYGPRPEHAPDYARR
ncbi:FAD-dependent oxidoreductase [Nonomuraea turcica]|uniref:FAD-dependent oxidoreductase n=1 Tax=Nonomuraea sp. G32 TaxID=3067274 RepID=UPI00273ACA6D|nr:FAD-dependent oxidoreductase [Nonomuraea sp. G32]MDP4505329.1 FAD-dependent oxidoreductase [Nonomuraea sp. G32]